MTTPESTGQDTMTAHVTHPLADHFGAVSVLDTRPEAALAVAEQLAAEEPAYWDMLEAAMAEGFAGTAAALRA